MKLSSLLAHTLLPACCSALLAACAAPAPQAATPLQPPSAALQDATPPRLSRITIASGATAHWQALDEARRIRALETLNARFSPPAAAGDQALAASPALSLDLAVEDIQLSSPVRAVVNHLLPVGVLVNAGKSLTGGSAARTMGSISLRGELREARTGTPVASFLVQESPDPMDLTAVTDQDAALDAAISRAADDLAQALAAARRGEAPRSHNGRLTLQAAPLPGTHLP